MKHIFTLKILFAIIIGFVVADVFTRTIFISNTYKINTQFIANLFKSKQSQTEFITTLKNLPLSAMKQVSSGVYAKEDKATNILYVRVTENAQFESRTINVEGKTMKVLFPKQVNK